jgi:hypothetical protein
VAVPVNGLPLEPEAGALPRQVGCVQALGHHTFVAKFGADLEHCVAVVRIPPLVIHASPTRCSSSSSRLRSIIGSPLRFSPSRCRRSKATKVTGTWVAAQAAMRPACIILGASA